MPVNHVVMMKFKDEATPKEIQPVSYLASHTSNANWQPSQIVNQMLDLKNRCLHPATAKPYILSSKGGRENSIEGLHVCLTLDEYDP